MRDMKIGQVFRMDVSEEQELMAAAVAGDVEFLHELWRESYEAELAGGITRALALHEKILSRIGTSYAAYLRAGRLHYRAGGYKRSLSFYMKALLLSPSEDAPLCGMLNCYVAMGDRESAARASRSLHSTEASMHYLDYQIAV